MKKGLFILILLLCLAGCKRKDIDSTEKQIYNPGVYDVTSQGEYGEMLVEVELSETRIESITILSSCDTNSFVSEVRSDYLDSIITSQNTEVDMVVGCTGTCQGVKDAVEQVVEENAYEQTEQN